jgi:hypothetical protein
MTNNRGLFEERRIMKSKIVIAILAVIIVVFSAGYLTAKKVFDKPPTREIVVGYDNKEHEGQIDFKKIITDKDDSGSIDDILLIYINDLKTIVDGNVNKEHPDVYIIFNNGPNLSAGRIYSKVWFTNDGAVIENSGKYSSLTLNVAEYLKKLIDYKKN